MRVIGLIGLVLALVIVGMLAKKQLGVAATPALPQGDARVQAGQIQDQIKQSLDAAQQRRPMPDDN